MATITAAQQKGVPQEGPCALWLWETLTATNNVGSAVAVGHRPGKSVHVVGTFGTGNLKLRGSNLLNPNVTVDGDWFNLTNPNTQAEISLTANGGAEILESCLWVSPKADVGTTDVDVWLLVTSARSRS